MTEKQHPFPFTPMGEHFVFDRETFIRPSSTWTMHREAYTYQYSYHSYRDQLPEDIRDIAKGSVVVLEKGSLYEVQRDVNYGLAYSQFPNGKPREYDRPHDPYNHYHMLSCFCKYLMRCEVILESLGFVRRIIDRTVEIKFTGRAMIDGNTRKMLRDEEALKVWNRDFSVVHAG